MPLLMWFSDYGNRAKVFSVINLLVTAYEVLTFWLDVSAFGYTFIYVLIYLAFILPTLPMAVFLLLGVQKGQLQKIWIWWIFEIPALTLYLTLFVIGAHRISAKVVLNLLIYTGYRIYGLKIIFDYMITLNSESSLSKVQPSPIKHDASFEAVPLNDPWSNTDSF